MIWSDWCVARKLVVMVVVVVTPWWQEMVEGRRKWSSSACQVAEIRGNVAKQKLPRSPRALDGLNWALLWGRVECFFEEKKHQETIL